MIQIDMQHQNVYLEGHLGSHHGVHKLIDGVVQAPAHVDGHHEDTVSIGTHHGPVHGEPG